MNQEKTSGAQSEKASEQTVKEQQQATAIKTLGTLREMQAQKKLERAAKEQQKITTAKALEDLMAWEGNIGHKAYTLIKTVQTFSIKPYKAHEPHKYLVKLAWVIASKAFELDGVKRNYTGEPYMTHPEGLVAVMDAFAPVHDFSVADKAVALLHDTIEETFVTEEMLLLLLQLKVPESLAKQVVGPVVALTPLVYAEDEKPARAKRERIERERYLEFDSQIVNLKLIDSIHNLSNVALYDFKFAIRYAQEKQQFIDLVGHKANKQILDYTQSIVSGILIYSRGYRVFSADYANHLIVRDIVRNHHY